MDGIHEILKEMEKFAGGDVLATVIEVEGSAYRKEGASMLFKHDGTAIGMISAGCLETDLSIRVQEWKGDKTSKTMVYDMRAEDDLTWGQGSGCNGKLHILLEPIDAYLHDHLCRLKGYLDSGKKVTLMKKLNKDHSVSDYLFFAGCQDFFGVWHGPIPVEVKKLLRDSHHLNSKSGIVMVPQLSAEIYIQSYEPRPRLIMFGAGLDARPIVKMAAQIGFSVTVSDWRPALCNERYFPEAEQLLVGFPHETVPMLELTNNDFVLLLTHHFQRDKEILRYVMRKQLAYLGVLGPRTRTEKLFDGKPIPSYINSPVGLAIGAEGPEEIAVSILAEMIKVRRGNVMEAAVST